jgi:hypothetical protein
VRRRLGNSTLEIVGLWVVNDFFSIFGLTQVANPFAEPASGHGSSKKGAVGGVRHDPCTNLGVEKLCSQRDRHFLEIVRRQVSPGDLLAEKGLHQEVVFNKLIDVLLINHNAICKEEDILEKGIAETFQMKSIADGVYL